MDDNMLAALLGERSRSRSPLMDLYGLNGDNYGYVSSMPLSQTPVADAGLGMVQQLGGVGALAATPFQGIAAPLSGAAGIYLLSDGSRRVRRSADQMKGVHPDQSEMDEYVNAMRYYGQKPMGPR